MVENDVKKCPKCLEDVQCVKYARTMPYIAREIYIKLRSMQIKIIIRDKVVRLIKILFENCK